MFLDKGVFEDQCLFFGIGDDELNVGNPFEEEPYVPSGISRAAEVGANPLFKVAGLSHIEDRCVCPLHEIDAGGGGKIVRSVNADHGDSVYQGGMVQYNGEMRKPVRLQDVRNQETKSILHNTERFMTVGRAFLTSHRQACQL